MNTRTTSAATKTAENIQQQEEDPSCDERFSGELENIIKVYLKGKKRRQDPPVCLSSSLHPQLLFMQILFDFYIKGNSTYFTLCEKVG